jgi:hypothetical protein
LQLERKFFRPAQLGKMALAVLLIAVLLPSLLLAASPLLHGHLHQDASQASHQCAITFFQQHQLLTSESNTVIVDLNFGLPVSIVVADFSDPSAADYRFSASRAPPFIFSPLV